MNQALSVVSRCEDDTLRLGSAVLAHAGDSAVVGLVGDLGTGKTRFVEGAARGAGYEGRVRSPTFTLLNLYEGRCRVRHHDLFRAEHLEDREVDEWAELWDEAGITFIEWADRLDGVPFGSRWPRRSLFVHFAHRGGDLRRIVLEARAGVWQGLFHHLEADYGHAYSRD